MGTGVRRTPTWPSSTRPSGRSRVGENVSVFHGHEAAGLRASPRAPRMRRSSWTPHRAISRCRGPGGRCPPAVRASTGPTGSLSARTYTEIVETTEYGGHLLFDHLRAILGGPLVWSPGVQGGVVLSLRGGDFQFDSGQDFSIGYLDHDADVIRLYLEESFSFRVLEPDAAVTVHLEP